MKHPVLRILTVIISPVIYSGGAEIAALEVSKSLSHIKGLKVTIATMAKETAIENRDGVTLKKFKSLIPPLIPSPYRQTLILPGKLLNEIKKENYDIVHIHNTFPALAVAQVARRCQQENLPYVYSTHGIVEASILKKTYPTNILVKVFSRILMDRPLKYAISHAKKIAASTEYERPIVIDYQALPQNVRVVYNGINSSLRQHHSTIDFRQKYQLKDRGLIVLYVGVIKENKGIDLLIRAAPLLADCRIIIAGGQSQPEYLKTLTELAQQLNVESKILFTGFVDNETLNSLYHGCDIFVLPTRADTLPLCILDAMACQKPVVSTTIGGVPEEVGPENGILVEPNNHRLLAAALNRLLADKRLREKMGKNGYRKIDNKFTWNKVAAKVATIYYEK